MKHPENSDGRGSLCFYADFEDSPLFAAVWRRQRAQQLVDSSSRSLSTTVLVVAENSAARACEVNDNPAVNRMANNSYTANAVLKSGTPSQRPAFVARITAIVLITSGFARPQGASPVSTRTMFSA